jgi:hypothetical protein
VSRSSLHCSSRPQRLHRPAVACRPAQWNCLHLHGACRPAHLFPPVPPGCRRGAAACRSPARLAILSVRGNTGQVQQPSLTARRARASFTSVSPCLPGDARCYLYLLQNGRRMSRRKRRAQCVWKRYAIFQAPCERGQRRNARGKARRSKALSAHPWRRAKHNCLTWKRGDPKHGPGRVCHFPPSHHVPSTWAR